MIRFFNAAFVITLLVFTSYSETVFNQKHPQSMFGVKESRTNETIITFTLDKVSKNRTFYPEFGEGYEFDIEYEQKSQPQYGAPSLPTLECFVKIPNTGDIEIELGNVITENVGTIAISPFQEPLKWSNYGSRKFLLNTEIYNQNAFYPSCVAKVSSCEIWREIRVARITVNPLQYNPVTKEVKMITSAEIIVKYNRSTTGINELKLVDNSITASFFPLYEGVLNCDINEMRQNMNQKPGCYVFMGSVKTLDAVKDLINWKTRKGYNVKTAVIGSDSIAASVDGIDTWIEKVYQNWPQKPEYIMIVGDERVAPSKIITQSVQGITEKCPADVYFGVIGSTDQKPVPSIYLGRITGNKRGTSDDMQNLKYIAWKIIKYESNPEEGDYLDRMLSFAVKDQQPGDNIGLKIGKEWNETIGNNFSITKGTDKVGSDNGTVMNSTKMYEELNKSVSLFTSVCHGYHYTIGLSDSDMFDTSKVSSLKNGTKFPYVISLACLIGNWTPKYCLLESFLNEGSIENPRGAVTAYGYTVMSSENTNGIISNGLKNYFNGKVYHMGAAILSAVKNALSKDDAMGGTLFGCPEIDIYTTNPLKVITVEHSIPAKGKFSVTVKENGNPVKDALVGIVSKNYENLSSGFTNASGILEGVIENSNNSGDSILLTVTSHDCKAYFKTIKTSATGITNQTIKNTNNFSIHSLPNINGFQVSFTSVIPTSAQLRIFNIHGVTVDQKKIEVVSSGRHSFIYTTNNIQNKNMPSGIYFIDFSIENKQYTNKWKLLR